MRKPVVLIVDDDEQIRAALKHLLGGAYDTLSAGDCAEALEAVGSNPVDIVLMDLNLPDTNGLKALRIIKQTDDNIGVIMLTATNCARQAVDALKMGAYDYITKPFDNDDLLSTLKRYVDKATLESEVEYLKEELNKEFVYCEIISKSPKMKRVFGLISMVSGTSSSVLITGESGTGKELVARAIQSMSLRKDKPFVAVNCGAVPAELIESELFGHEKGAFTGAHARKIGKFEYADEGTVFLDEVSTIPMNLQIKLLRVLQEKTFERVGSNIPIRVDIRVLAATNIDLEEAVRQGRFREDLYYRLKVVPVELPPLRERKEDIPLLIRHFLDKHSMRCNKKLRGITQEAVAALTEYHWPGNIRELENLIERLVVLAKANSTIRYNDLPSAIFSQGSKRQSDSDANGLKEASQEFERRYIIEVLNKTNWNRAEAARHMNIHRNTLLMKMKSLGIKGPRKAYK
jgi:DNA-binding NtrC family response regulator